MNFKITIVAAAVLAALVVSGCKTEPSPTQIPGPEDIVPTGTETTYQIPLPTQTSEPTLTHTPESTPTPEPTLTITPSPTQVVQSGITRRLCPQLKAPLGLISVPDPLYDNSTELATLYVLYQVVELSSDSTAEPCTFYLSPPPMGDPQLAGESLFWKSFDYEAEWVMVWNYDPQDVLTDDAFPQHLPLRQTRTDTSIGKSGLFDFVVAESGETLVWSYTDPQTGDDFEMSYLQVMYAASTTGPIDQRPAADVWFDFVFEPDSETNIIRPREISSDGELVFYSQEPVGLGSQWPEPLGRYTSLFSISTFGDAYPVLHFDCGKEYWCISDFSEEQDILVSVQGDTIRIFELSSGELIREVLAPEAYPLARQALIGPDGAIAFMGVASGETGYGDPPENVAIFLIGPPYQDEPVLVLGDAGLRNLLGWASPGLLLADGIHLEGRTPRVGMIPSDLMLVDVETGVGRWLPLDADLFVSLVP